jgi:hypothetical protein
LAESTLTELLPVVPAVPVEVELPELEELPQAARLQVIANVSASARNFFILLILSVCVGHTFVPLTGIFYVFSFDFASGIIDRKIFFFTLKHRFVEPLCKFFVRFVRTKGIFCPFKAVLCPCITDSSFRDFDEPAF